MAATASWHIPEQGYFHNSPGKVHVSSHLAKEALNLGYIKLSDGLTIAIYEVELSDNVDIERNRRGIRDMLTTDWRTNHAGAFYVLLSQEWKHTTFLLCKRDLGLQQTGGIWKNIYWY